ncbi:MAG: transcription-repair coupling factor [Balneolales bacterium]|nr:transcription-repair coupling factor [Balneolales bacterium]
MAISHIRAQLLPKLPLADILSYASHKELIRLEGYAGALSSILAAELSDRVKHAVFIFPDEERAQFFAGDLAVLGVQNLHFFPDSNNKAYQEVGIHDSATLVQRAEVLDSVIQNDENILVASAPALCEKVISPQSFSASAIELYKGLETDMEGLREQLIDSGYTEVSFVEKPGEMAVRGGIFDIFPYTGDYPVRLEFFGDEIDSLRHFDADSQRSISFLDSVRIVPNTSAFNSTERESLLNYFPADTLYVMFNPPLCDSAAGDQLEKARAVYDALLVQQEKQRKKGDDDLKALPAPEQLFMSPDELRERLSGYARIYLGEMLSGDADFGFRHELGGRPQPVFNGAIKLLDENLRELSRSGVRTFILCGNTGQRDRLAELLGDPSDALNYELSVETLHEGFILPDEGLAMYTDHQIFNRYHRPKTKRRAPSGGISFKELKDLNMGDYVVHVDYGIGRFSGFQKIKVKDSIQEVVVLKYQEDSVLYVNVSSLYKIQKYSGKDGHQPRVTKLGSGEWARKKASAKRKVKDIARELIQLYARRKAQRAHAFPPDSYMQTEMEAAFIFEETPDQLKAIEDVKADMQRDMPMDRLICGDVGFGKTEVAVRAAFKAALDGKQVALLVPTTILADQHYKTFKSRLDPFPVNVDLMSRFRTKAEQKETLEKLKAGQVDILIGTHRITSKDVEFKNLGLLIIDEEQRFGVATKEKIKRFRAAVDTLTLTATPIPRTLQYSLMGARDLSVINTPPPNRQPVQTDVIGFDGTRIRDAIVQEVSRGGQVFFIHNRVHNIEEMAGLVMDLVPNIKVRFAHGQMKGTELERIILDFYAHKFDVLISTNIVESGIDIANANTIIINHADKFGLSELHQLRGRVGRSNRKAFCYLISPPFQALPDDSRKRLMALVEYADLGSGFSIAMRDLDIRGAGDILGGEQSGFISDVGFDLYTKILNDAVRELKESEFADLFGDQEPDIEYPETTVEFDEAALLPQWYVRDNVERLNLYRRLAGAQEVSQIEEWATEIEDRFGKVPAEAQTLIQATHIKLLASRLLFVKVTIRAGRIWLLCPSAETLAGELFYAQARMPKIISELQQAGREVNVAQRDQAIRIVVSGVADMEACIRLLEQLVETFPAGKEVLAAETEKG